MSLLACFGPPGHVYYYVLLMAAMETFGQNKLPNIVCSQRTVLQQFLVGTSGSRFCYLPGCITSDQVINLQIYKSYGFIYFWKRQSSSIKRFNTYFELTYLGQLVNHVLGIPFWCSLFISAWC